MWGRKQDYNISLSEFSGEVCLVLYHSPCFLNCNWCFNKNNLKSTLLNYESAVKIIEDNKEYISSVCLSGGEPFLSKDFYDICEYVKDNGLKLKINTSGIVSPYLDDLDADYVNISFKGDFSRYSKLGFKGSEDELKYNIENLSSHNFSDLIEWSIVYHPLIIDLEKVKLFMDSLSVVPDFICLNQLQVGDCLDSFINDFTPPSRADLVDNVKLFREIPTKHLLIESREFGREIIL